MRDERQITYRGRCRVLMIEPSAKTTVKLITQSFIVPYLTAFVPLARLYQFSLGYLGVGGGRKGFTCSL